MFRGCSGGVTVVLLQWYPIGVPGILRRCYSDVPGVFCWCSGMFRGCSDDVTVVIRWCSWGVSMMFRWCLGVVPVVFKYYWCSGIPVVFWGYYDGVPMMFRGCSGDAPGVSRWCIRRAAISTMSWNVNLPNSGKVSIDGYTPRFIVQRFQLFLN